MKRLVVFPSDPMKDYLDKGQTYEYFEDYFNPGGYFDEVYALSPWGNRRKEQHGKIIYIKARPWEFKWLVSKIKPDVVRAYGGYHCADWLALSQTSGIPTVVSIHDTNPKLIFDSIKYADNVICMAQCVQDAVRAKVDCREKGEYIMPNRIDTELFSPVIDNKLEKELNERFGEGRHILHVGRKSEQKNIDTLIKAISFLPEDISVIFVGSGDFAPYEKLAQEEGVNSRVFCVDCVDNVDLPKWYSWCDCFCTPSRWEGFGFVFIEAASCKTPIVTSDIAPMNEYLTDGVDSVLVKEYENPSALANAILKVLDGNVDLVKMRKNARLVGQKFKKEIVDQQEMQIYQEIIARGAVNKVPFGERLKLNLNYWNFC